MANELRTRDGLPFNFVDGLRIKGVDVTNWDKVFIDQGASYVGFQPVGNLAASNVQAAIAELESEKQSKTEPITTAINLRPGANQGVVWNDDAFGGGYDKASITLEAASGEATKMRFKIANDSDDNFEFTAKSEDGLTAYNSAMTLNGNVLLNAANYVDYAAPMITDYTALRTYAGNATQVRITDPGIAGFFYYDAADTSSVDNGGTVIVSVNGKRWRRLFSGSVDLAWFGAKGDWNGTAGTDDTTSIRNCVDYCLKNEINLSSTSGKVYRITAEINFPKYFSGAIRKWLTFDFGGSTLYLDGSNFTCFGYTKIGNGLLDSANYYLIFKNISFKSIRYNGVIAFRSGGFINCKFINLHFYAVDYPFYQQNDDLRGTPNYVQSAHIEGCYSIQHRRFFNANQVYEFRFVGNFIDSGEDGIWIDRTNTLGQAGYVCDISGNAFQSHSHVSILLGGMQALTLSKNYFENNSKEVVLVGTLTQPDGPNGVYWEYIALVDEWITGASITDSGVYKTYAGNLYVSSSIGVTGSTAPSHTNGTVTDGTVAWTYIGTYSAWSSGTVVGDFGQFKSNSSKIYRSSTRGTTGSVGPTHTTGSVTNYGGSIENNFNQPKAVPQNGYRAFIELEETPGTGFNLGGNVDQAQKTYYFSRFSTGYFNTLGDRTALKTSDLYNPVTRPDAARIIFADSQRFGILWGNSGGMVLNPISRGIEYTNSEFDYLDPVTNQRVPIVQGVANIAPPGFGAGLEGKAFAPSDYPQLYPQKPWARGSFLINPTPTVQGTAGSQYVTHGWTCTVSGTPGTWVPSRTLSGT